MSSRLRRYLVWTFRCRRGRRCVHLVVRPDAGELGKGQRLRASRACARCGTNGTVR